jgi:hypothetical protein
VGSVVVRSEPAAATGVLSGGDSLRRKGLLEPAQTLSVFNYLNPISDAKKRIGGPDFHQFEPADELGTHLDGLRSLA